MREQKKEKKMDKKLEDIILFINEKYYIIIEKLTKDRSNGNTPLLYEE